MGGITDDWKEDVVEGLGGRQMCVSCQQYKDSEKFPAQTPSQKILERRQPVHQVTFLANVCWDCIFGRSFGKKGL